MLTYYANPFLIAAAVIPAAVLLIYVYKADRLEHEPMKLLLPLILYGVMRFLIEFMRGDHTDSILGLTPSQFIAVAIAIPGGIIVACVARSLGRKQEKKHAEESADA